MVYFHIFMFLCFQVVAHLLFKWGSVNPQNYWYGFILGNIVGASSIIFMLGMFKSLPAASVLAIGTGGSFILNQIFLNLVYHEKVNYIGIIGIILIFAGILTVAFSGNLLKSSGDDKPSQTAITEKVES